ncbi:MAG TPA: YegP family protein [Anaerolineae bacterium]|nr:YegP family protein [Anaerolineae bacterium]
MAGQFELKKSDKGQFMFNLKAANGQIILTSQRYQAKASASDGIASVKKHAADDANFERRTSAAGEPYFVLKAANNQVIGTSEMYTSIAAMEKGIASVMANAPDAPVVDATA